MESDAPRGLAIGVLLAAGAALSVALVSERWAGLVPCALCLLERWPYRAAVILGMLGFILPRRIARPLLWLAVLVVLAGAGLAALHVGVEQGWWPSPLPECAAPRLAHGSVAQLLASMPARPAKPCDAPTFLIPGLPLSMAAMNLIYAVLFAALLAIALLRDRRRRA